MIQTTKKLSLDFTCLAASSQPRRMPNHEKINNSDPSISLVIEDMPQATLVLATSNKLSMTGVASPYLIKTREIITEFSRLDLAASVPE